MTAWKNPLPPHPAKYSDPLLPIFRELLRPLNRENHRATVLDPFAGTGKIHDLFPEFETLGIEIEPKWAAYHPRTWLGNSLRMPWYWEQHFDAVVTSCTYGNRMADHHKATEKCKNCFGTGEVENGLTCMKCEGRGRREYKRMTYRHQYGEELDPENSGQLQWGPQYRDFHMRAWMEVRRVMRVGGMFVLNVSDHIRARQVVEVSAWHRWCIEGLGFDHVRTIEVPTQRMGFGANYEARVDHEDVHVFTKLNPKEVV